MPPTVAGQPSTCSPDALFSPAFIHKSALIEFPLPGFISACLSASQTLMCTQISGGSCYSVDVGSVGVHFYEPQVVLVVLCCWSEDLNSRSRIPG